MKGYAHLALVLALLQAGLAVLAGLGQVVVMGGNPLYLPVPLARSALLVAAAAAIHRTWGAVTVVVLCAVSLFGFWASVLLGLVPWVVYPVNLTGLLVDLLLPASVAALAVTALARPAR